MNNNEIKKIIIKTIQDDGNRRILPGIIVKKITNEYYNINKRSIFNMIDNMIDSGELKQLGDKVILGYIDAPIDMSKIYQGTVSNITINSDAFITVYDDNQNVATDFYVNKIHVNGAIKGDIVKFALLQKDVSLTDRKEAAILEIIKRQKETFVATIELDDESYLVIPDDKRIYLDIIVDNLSDIHNNDKVLLKIDSFDNKSLFTSIIKTLGNSNNSGIDIMSVAYENNVPIEFSEDVILESEKLKFNITSKDLQVRKDIRDRQIITIDPATSKDLDDAIFVKKLPNGNYFLSVSIADVSYYVQPGTKLDESAYSRGTSVYLIDHVIPMLPHNISDNLCSLNPHENKMTLTCDVEINHHGEIIDFDVFPSIINNHHRFSYDEVNELFANNFVDNSHKLDSSLIDQLKIAKELHLILRKKKSDLGYIEFDIKEPVITLDDQGRPIAIDVKKSGIAQKMVEDFMVVANETVTLFAQKNNLDFIYRIHDKPDLKKITTFLIEAKKLGFICQFDYNNLSSKDFLELLKTNSNHPEFNLFNKLLLHAMQKAKYSVDNIGHFGLALENYTHFTSPIRRYADLIVHRIFWMFIFAKNEYSENQRFELKQQLSLIADECNLCEIRQVETERNVNAMKFAEYMSYHIGQTYEGVVSAIVSFGMFVELPNLIEGLVMIKNIGDDFYVFNPDNLTLVGQKSNKIYSLGSKVKVQVIGANKQDRKIDFKLIK